MLCEDKDTLRDEYALWHGSAAEFAALDPAAVRGKRVTPYGAEAVSYTHLTLPTNSRV